MNNMINKIMIIVGTMFCGTISCYASSFEDKFWVSCFEGFSVLLVPLVGITLGGLIIRAFGFVGVCFVFVAFILFVVICFANQGFPA